MKKSTLITMQDYISNLQPASNNDIILSLFKKFCELEVEKASDLLKVEEEYREFMTMTVMNFNCSMFEKFMFMQVINSFCNQLRLRINPYEFYNQSELVSDLVDIMPYKKDTKVLDVGSGDIPLASFAMSEVGPHATALEKDKFWVTHEMLKNFNIEPKDQTLFTEDTDISNYDMLFGVAPCEAFVPLVKNCGKHNKPYFVKMCKCGLPTDETGKPRKDYKSYLKVFDPKIRFYKSFAYNLDISESGLRKALKLTPDIKDPKIDDAIDELLNEIISSLFGQGPSQE